MEKILKEAAKVVIEFEIKLDLKNEANGRLKRDEGFRYSKEYIIKKYNLDEGKI